MTIQQIKASVQETIDYFNPPYASFQSGRVFQAEATLVQLNKLEPIELFKLECLTEDGLIEENGYYSKLEYAEKAKKELDNEPGNIRYNIKQNIIPIEIEQ